MNQFTVEEVIKDLETLVERIHSEECNKKNVMMVESIPFSLSFLKKGDGLDVIISEGIIPTKASYLFEFFLNFEVYVQYVPFIYKLNYIEKETIYNLIVEMEFNLIGFTKNALCLNRVVKELTNKSYILNLSITHDNSKIIPFRDSAILMQAITLEDTPEGCLIRDFEIIQPIPWLQSDDINESLDRFSYIPIRRMKSCLDYLKYDKSPERGDIINSITTERIGLESTLNGKQERIGEVWYESKHTRVMCVDYVCDQATFICEGSIEKTCEFRLSRETLLELVFQDRCQLIETKDTSTGIFYKSKPALYQNEGEDISFSTFIYSEKCALVHFKTVRMKSNKEIKCTQTYNFGSSYIYVFGCEGKWNIQFSIRIISKTLMAQLDNKEALHAMLQFLRNIELSFQSGSPLQNYKQPLKFITGTDPIIPPILKIQPSLITKISRFLNNKDIIALTLTCKQLREVMIYSSKLNQTTEIHAKPSLDSFEFDTSNDSSLHFDEWKQNTPKYSILKGHTNLIRALDINQDCSLLVSGSSDRKIRLWDLGDETSRTFVGPNSCLVSTKFTLNNHIASGYHCGTIRYINWVDSKESQVFDVNEGKLEGFLPLEQMDFIIWNEKITAYRYLDMHQTPLFSYSGHKRKVQIVKPFNKIFLSGSADRTIQLWDPISSNPTIAKIKAHKSGVVGLEQIDPYTFVSAGNDKIINFWDTRKLDQAYLSVNKKICNFSYSDGKLFCGTDNGEVCIFQTNKPEDCINLYSNNSTGLVSIASKKNIICCGFKDGTISLWKY